MEVPSFLSQKQQAPIKKNGFATINDWYKGMSRANIIVRTTPKWADRKAIKRIYLLAKQLSINSGIKYEVDHLIPLKSNNVCGLHVEDNLQIVERSKNRGLKPEFQYIE